MEKVVVWSKLTLIHLEKIHSYILTDCKSYEISDKVINTIINSTEVLRNQSELYPLDKYKLNNDGTYRAYELFHYRISYRILKNEIRIIRIRHTRRNPKIH